MVLLFGFSACGKESLVSSAGNSASHTKGINEGVVGRVTTSDLHPIAGAFLQVRSLGYTAYSPDIAILTNQDGWYQWRLPPGMYDLSVSAQGYRSAMKRLTVRRGEVVTLHFMLEHAP